MTGNINSNLIVSYGLLEWFKYGRFDCLKYIHDNGCGTEEGHITCIINFNNYVKCLQYIQQR